MKGHYITVYQKDFLGIGIMKKIDTQIELIRNQNIDISILSMENANQAKLTSKIRRRIPFFRTYVNYNYSDVIASDDFIYIRYQGADCNLIRFLKKVKWNNPNIKIIMEIPTYPYEGEQKINVFNASIIWKDRYNRAKLHKYVDRLVLVSIQDYRSLFGIKVINIKNGVDFEKIGIAHPTDKHEDNIHLVFVSRFSPWHGCERLINGLKSYYEQSINKINVILHIVGDGIEIPNYKALVDKYNLDRYVVFHGIKTGKELEEIYDFADVAIESLNRRKSGLNISSSLKSREYLAKGLPILAGCKVDIIGDDFPYIYILPNEDEVNVNDVVKFYKNLLSKKTVELMRQEIRQYGKKHADINVTYSPVVRYIKNM